MCILPIATLCLNEGKQDMLVTAYSTVRDLNDHIDGYLASHHVMPVGVEMEVFFFRDVLSTTS